MSCMTATVVLTHLDTEAKSNIVSSVMGTFSGTSDLHPKAFSYTRASRRTTPTTAPGMSPAAMEAPTVLSTRASRCASMPTEAGKE